MRHPSLCMLLLALVAGSPARAELYRWVDVHGRLHVTAHLDEVPPEHRPAAAISESASSRVQSYASRGAAPGGSSAATSSPRAASAPSSPNAVHVRVQRAGTGMVVQVRINERVSAPFLVDTGASDVLLPKKVADELGIRTGPETRTVRYTTANGIVEHPIVLLDSVDLGGARVEDVPASISPNMEMGLLGLSFFNHFTYRVDAAAGLITLSPNGMVEAGLIRGGRSEAQWRAEYANLRGRLGEVQAERARTPASHGREIARLGEEASRLDRQLADLETEADEARVPVGWRE